jgi:hypothetical protein
MVKSGLSEVLGTLGWILLSYLVHMHSRLRSLRQGQVHVGPITWEVLPHNQCSRKTKCYSCQHQGHILVPYPPNIRTQPSHAHRIHKYIQCLSECHCIETSLFGNVFRRSNRGRRVTQGIRRSLDVGDNVIRNHYTRLLIKIRPARMALSIALSR